MMAARHKKVQGEWRKLVCIYETKTDDIKEDTSGSRVMSQPQRVRNSVRLYVHIFYQRASFTIYFQILVTRGAGDDGEAVPGII